MQLKHPYEYVVLGGAKHGWRKEGKRLARDWPYVWACINPKTGKMALLTGEHPGDAPTRVPIEETWHNPESWATQEEPDCMPDDLKWRVLYRLIDDGVIVLAEKNVGVVGVEYLEQLIEREYKQDDNND